MVTYGANSRGGGERGREGLVFLGGCFFGSAVHTSDIKCLVVDAKLRSHSAVLGVCHRLCVPVRNLSYAGRDRSRPYSMMLLVL